MRSPFLASLFLSLASFAFCFGVSGCSDQSEGDRCDLKNGNEDCQSGLTCTSKQVLGGNSDICCAPNSTDVSCVPSSPTTSTSSTTASSSSSGAGGAGGAGGSTTSAGGAGGGGGAGGTTTSAGGAGGSTTSAGGAGGA